MVDTAENVTCGTCKWLRETEGNPPWCYRKCPALAEDQRGWICTRLGGSCDTADEADGETSPYGWLPYWESTKSKK